MAVAVTPGPPSAPSDDRPRTIVTSVSHGDRIFRFVMRMAGLAVLLITGLILVFLVLRSLAAFRAVGFHFFTTSTWFINTNQFGIAAILPLGILIALIIAVPVGLATALFISEYAPPRLRRSLIAVIDLMAAIPSIIVALFGLYFVMPRILGTTAWLSHHLGFILFFHNPLPNAPASWVGSTFIAGVMVSVMVIPI